MLTKREDYVLFTLKRYGKDVNVLGFAPSALWAPPPCRGGIVAAGIPPLQGGGAQRAEGAGSFNHNPTVMKKKRS